MRPFFDLTGRIGATSPARVVDLGCGPGQLTATLAERWPTATVEGVDSSPEMIERAAALAHDRLTFAVGDVRSWTADAAGRRHRLQRHAAVGAGAPGTCCPRWSGTPPRPTGWFAFQVPANFTEPSHVLLLELAADPRFAAATDGVEQPSSFAPEVYLSDLLGLGLRVDAWESTYLHLLTGEDPVFRWIAGTGARPILQALTGRAARRSSCGSTRRCFERRTRPVPMAPSCRSAGSSSSRSGWRRDCPAPRAGRLPAWW